MLCHYIFDLERSDQGREIVFQP